MNHDDRYPLALTDFTHRRRLGPVATGVICSLALLSACSSDTSTAGAEETTATTAPATTATVATTPPPTEPPTTSAAVTTSTAAEPRVVVAKGTFGDVPGTLVVLPANADGTTPSKGELALSGDIEGSATFDSTFLLRQADNSLPYVSDWTVDGTLAGLGSGTFSVHEEGVFGADGSQDSSGTVVGLTGVFEGATGTITYSGETAASAEFEITFTWPPST